MLIVFGSLLITGWCVSVGLLVGAVYSWWIGWFGLLVSFGFCMLLGFCGCATSVRMVLFIVDVFAFLVVML